MFGRRRIFFIGSVIFAVASVLGGFAPNVGLLLTCRAVMGIGGAMMWPAILGMTYGILPAAKAGLAGGIILGAAGFGNAVGPLLGGVLTDWLSWRWIFFLNLPITAFAMFITWRIVPADEGICTDHRIDYGGIITLSLGLVALLLALDEGTSLGWTDSRIVGLFVLAGISLAAFALVETRAGVTALVPKDVLKNRTFFAACMTVLLMSAIFFSALLYLPQFTAKVLNYSAAACGAGLLPMMGVYAVTSFVAGPLYGKLGPKVIVSLGSLFLAAGIFIVIVRSSDDHLRGPDSRNGGAGCGRRVVLFVGYHGGRDGAGSDPDESCRRNYLYVPDCGRLHWTGFEHSHCCYLRFAAPMY